MEEKAMSDYRKKDLGNNSDLTAQIFNQKRAQRDAEEEGKLLTFKIKPSKGQLISECLFDVLNFPKNQRKKFDKFLPQNLKSGQMNKIKALSYDNIIYT